MGHYYDEIPDDPSLIEWIKDQKLFHVGSAPIKGGHINVSPKGQQTFKLVNRKACWYLDLTGSGNETISHLYEPGNGRLVIMFEAFQGPPRILRFWGQGKVFERGSPEFERLINEGASELGFSTPEMLPGARAIIWLDITRVGTSCGYSVPFMKFEAHRDTLNNTMAKREKNDENTADPFELPPGRGLHSYWAAKNSWSLDGLPGVQSVAQMIRDDRVDEVLKDAGLSRESVFGKSSGKGAGLLPSGTTVGIVIGFSLALLLQAATSPPSRSHHTAEDLP
ncbi:hypothetical protein BC629DRAFT_1589413 [Irpex lacteus]|nr:hypothetical protein BC629DRAFT_1589413 [Irpex lacteus]